LLRSLLDLFEGDRWFAMVQNDGTDYRIVEDWLLLQLVKSKLLRKLEGNVLEGMTLLLGEVIVHVNCVTVLDEGLAELTSWHGVD
tara:strand:+ start:1014 stop:1268 length:255 start_codon:yes stop_codon:yes gene_type:complete